MSVCWPVQVISVTTIPPPPLCGKNPQSSIWKAPLVSYKFYHLSHKSLVLRTQNVKFMPTLWSTVSILSASPIVFTKITSKQKKLDQEKVTNLYQDMLKFTGNLNSRFKRQIIKKESTKHGDLHECEKHVCVKCCALYVPCGQELHVIARVHRVEWVIIYKF